MPVYRKKNAKKFKGFSHAREMIHFLSKTHPEHPTWKKIRNAAKMHKATKDTPFLHQRSLRAVATKHPKTLARDVLLEMRQSQKGKPVGGGISEVINWLTASSAVGRVTGKVSEFLGLGYEHKRIPHEQQLVARALDETYSSIEDRPTRVGSLERLTQYDTDRYSVWDQPNGQKLVTVHGTQLTANDIGSDLLIAGGQTMNAPRDLQNLLNTFDREGVTYDLAAHSLGTEYLINSTHENADSIYLFNAASSPVQSTDMLRERANNNDYTYFISPSDLVSNGLFQQMNNESVNNNYISNYQFSPLASHQLGQWYQNVGDDQLEFAENEAE